MQNYNRRLVETKKKRIMRDDDPITDSEYKRLGLIIVWIIAVLWMIGVLIYSSANVDYKLMPKPNVKSYGFSLDEAKFLVNLTEVPDSVTIVRFYNYCPNNVGAEYNWLGKAINIYCSNSTPIKVLAFRLFHELQHHNQHLKDGYLFIKNYNVFLEHDKRPYEIEANKYAHKRLNNITIINSIIKYELGGIND